MFLSSRLRIVNPSAPAALTRGRKAVRPRAGFRPQLEALEDRRLMATHTSVSVRDLIADINAVNTAGGAHTIVLAPGTTFSLQTANNTNGGPNGLPVIGATKAVALTIVGNGDTIERVGGFTYSKRGKPVNPFRLFNVAPGASLSLDRVTLKGGWAHSSTGGGVYNRGTLNVANGSVVSGNQATNAGGGIHNAGGTVTVSHSTISDGRARDGGGIFSDGTLTVGDSTLSSNLGSYGGGICNRGTLTVTHTTLSKNYTSGLHGGGIYNGGGKGVVSNSTVTSSQAGDGAGIYNNGGTLTITGSTLSGNNAHWDYSARGGYGGAVYNNAGTVTIGNSIVSGNVADQYRPGDGIYNAPGATLIVRDSSRITENIGYYDGGEDVANFGVLYQDDTSTIDVLVGNPAILI